MDVSFANDATHSPSTTLWDGITKKQFAILAFLGVLFWFIAAMVILFGEPFGILGPQSSLITFALNLPISWGLVIVIGQLAQLRPAQIVPGISFALALAACCDAIALTWAPWLYGSQAEYRVLGGAAILWGVFAFIAGAFFESYRRSRAAA